jgi:hypothetical protein
MSRTLVGVAVATALLVPLSGCGGGATSPAKKPAETLAAAVAKTSGINLAFEVIDAASTDAGAATGTYDGASKLSMITSSSNGESTQVISSADTLYLSGYSQFAGKTYRMQIAKMAATSGTGPLVAPLFPLLMLSGTTKVKSADGWYSGSIDVARVRAGTVGEQKFVEIVTKTAADRANAVTFKATVDDKGYLNRVNIVFPGMAGDKKDAELNVTYSAFGAPATIAVPTGATVVDAPDEMYTA